MEYWLARIYEALYPDEQPNASRLYLRFGLPLPRAQYLTRLLLARRSAHWRDTAHAEVVAVLEPWEKDAAEAKKKGVGSSTPYKLSLSRGAYDELIVIYDRMAAPVAAKDRPSPPKREPSSPTMVWFQISALGVLALLEQIRKDL